jgi:antitoxin YefM
MINGIKRRGIVGKDGKIEIQAPEFPEGTAVEIIVLVDSAEEDTTDYLLSTPANRNHLLQALEQTATPENLVTITPEEWHEKYHL